MHPKPGPNEDFGRPNNKPFRVRFTHPKKSWTQTKIVEGRTTISVFRIPQACADAVQVHRVFCRVGVCRMASRHRQQLYNEISNDIGNDVSVHLSHPNEDSGKRNKRGHPDFEGSTFQGVSTRFGLRTIEKSVENMD